MTKKKRVYHSLSEKRAHKRIAIASVLGVLVVVALCFVFGFAIAEGWDAVARWFTSKWATLTVVSFLIVVMALLYAFFAIKDRKDFR